MNAFLRAVEERLLCTRGSALASRSGRNIASIKEDSEDTSKHGAYAASTLNDGRNVARMRKRLVDVVRLRAEGLTFPAIARRLDISERQAWNAFRKSQKTKELP